MSNQFNSMSSRDMDADPDSGEYYFGPLTLGAARLITQAARHCYKQGIFDEDPEYYGDASCSDLYHEGGVFTREELAS